MRNGANGSPGSVTTKASLSGAMKVNDQEGLSGDSLQDLSRDGARPSSRRSLAILAVILLGTAALYFLLYDPVRFGFLTDDGLYVTTAKALASGEGYRIISLPYEPAATTFPPFYPFLLSLIWRFNPNFPSNLNAMAFVSGIATLILLAMTWQYFVKQRYATSWQAFLIVVLVAVNWRTVIYATGIYSEMTYTALSVIALYLAEGLEKSRKSRISGLLLGLVLGLAFLTRTAGVTLLVAIAAYFLIRKKIRSVLLPLAIGALCVVGWFVWCYLNRTTFTGVNVAYYTNYLQHFRNVLLDIQANTHESMAMTVLGVLWGNFLMAVVVSVPVLCLGLDYNWVFYLGFVLMFIASGFIRDVSRRWRPLHVYIICYLGLHIAWLPFVSYDRYLSPILPFVLLWFVRELETMASLARRTLGSEGRVINRASAAVIGLAVIAMASATIYSYGSTLYFSVASASFNKEVKPSTDDAEAIEWIKANTDPSNVVVCARDTMYYLYTGRHATSSLAMTGTVYWEEKQKLIFDIVDQSNGKYLVLTPSDFEEHYRPDLQTQSFKDMIEEHRERFVPVFTSKNGRSIIYRTDTY